METHTVQQAQENPLLKPLSENPQVRQSSREGSLISPIGSLRRSFSFQPQDERLEPHTPSSLTSGGLPSSATETQKASSSVTEKQLHHPPESSKWTNLLYGWWTFELLAFVVSFVSLIAIIIILKHYNGQSPPDWPHHVTLNSVLSWFTTLFKTSLLVPIASCFGQTGWLHYRSTSQPLADIGIYDSASRGPLGSLQLLWKFKTKYVASIGAIATILALGVDPIVQQTLSIRLKILELNNSATLGRAQSFLQWDLQDYSTFVSLAPGVNSDPPADSEVLLPPTEMVAAMFDGIYSGDGGPSTLASGPRLSCLTGNCTFSPFQTLAVCPNCENMTNTLSERCFHQGTGGVQGPPGVAAFCEYSLPNGLKMNKTLGPSTVATSGGLATIGSIKYPQSIFNFTGIWGGAPSTMPDFEVAPPYGSKETDAVGKAEEDFLRAGDLRALQCFLYWCVQILQVDVVNGQVEETTMNTWYNETTLPPDTMYGVDLYGDEFVSYILAREVWALQPPRLGSNGSASNFTVARYASEALSDWLAAHLTITTSRSWDAVASDPNSAGLSQREFEKQRLLLSTNVTKMFEDLAATMTHYLRSTSLEDQTSSHGPQSSHSQGQSSNPEPYITVDGASLASGITMRSEILVSVRWPWLAFPAALLLIALAFFILTLLSTSRHRLEVWKTSPFPLIFNRIDDARLASRSEMEPVQSVKAIDMERRAAEISARLEESDIGPRLTGSIGHLHDDSDIPRKGSLR